MIIDGKEYGYHFPLAVLRTFEKSSRVNIFGLSDTSKLSAEASGRLVFLGARAWAKREGEEFNYTLEEVLELVTLADVKEALEELMPDEGEEKKRL